MGHLVRGRDRVREVRNRARARVRVRDWVTLGLGLACGRPPALAPCCLAPASHGTWRSNQRPPGYEDRVRVQVVGIAPGSARGMERAVELVRVRVWA